MLDNVLNLEPQSPASHMPQFTSPPPIVRQGRTIAHTPGMFPRAAARVLFPAEVIVIESENVSCAPSFSF